MTPMQELIEVLKIHRDTAFEKEKMCGAEAKSYYEGRAKAFEDAITFAEVHLDTEKEVIMQTLNDGKAMAVGNIENQSLQYYYNKTFNTKEK